MTQQSGVFEYCLNSSDQDDLTGLMQCISQELEGKQKMTASSMNSFLLILSVRCWFPHNSPVPLQYFSVPWRTRTHAARCSIGRLSPHKRLTFFILLYIGSSGLFHAGWLCHALRWISEKKEHAEHYAQELVRCNRSCSGILLCWVCLFLWRRPHFRRRVSYRCWCWRYYLYRLVSILWLGKCW